MALVEKATAAERLVDVLTRGIFNNKTEWYSPLFEDRVLWNELVCIMKKCIAGGSLDVELLDGYLFNDSGMSNWIKNKEKIPKEDLDRIGLFEDKRYENYMAFFRMSELKGSIFNRSHLDDTPFHDFKNYLQKYLLNQHLIEVRKTIVTHWSHGIWAEEKRIEKETRTAIEKEYRILMDRANFWTCDVFDLTKIDLSNVFKERWSKLLDEGKHETVQEEYLFLRNQIQFEESLFGYGY
ncbi:MAG: hypothetical protein HY917_05405 [Candidatus Diapherotrites archaeon]|nr:hypothetical protein [Candidatus Diapherotrites archaeon]